LPRVFLLQSTHFGVSHSGTSWWRRGQVAATKIQDLTPVRTQHMAEVLAEALV